MNAGTAFLPGRPPRGRRAPQPLGALWDDHRRIRGHCRTLQSLRAFVASARFDRDAQLAGHFLLRFFDVQVPLHCLDEEEVLYPLLIESMAGSDATCIRELTQRSRRDHLTLGTMWSALRSPLLSIAGGHRAVLDHEQVSRFSQAWESQIRLEETELLPMAERLLTAGETDEIGRRMRERRC